MKIKDVLILVVAIIVIGTSGYFAFKMIFPSSEKSSTSTNQESSTAAPTVPAQIDETTYKTVITLSDYGKPELSGIGKADLFANY